MTASGSSTPPSMPASISSTPPTSTPPASRKRSRARPSQVGATTSSSPRSSSCPWTTTRTIAAGRGDGSSKRSRSRSDDSAQTGSTSTRCIARCLDTDIEETLGALSDLVHQGKIRYLGSSSFSGSQIVEAQWTSRERNLQRFVTEQPPYSILVRGIEEDVLPTTMRHGMGTLTYSPLSGGWLSGKWRKDAASSPTSSARPSARFDMSQPANQRKLDIVEELAQLAEQNDMTLIELAIAFAINHPGVTSAIVGPRTMEQLASYLPAADIVLGDQVLDRIDELVAPGVTINPDDNSYGASELAPGNRRR